MSSQTWKPLVIGVVMISALQGCGGGGGGGSNTSSNSSVGTTTNSATTGTTTTLALNVPAAPVLALDLGGIKQLKLSWNAVGDATTTYNVLEDVDGASGFNAISSNLSAAQTNYTQDIAVHTQNWANAHYQVQACNAAGCSTSNTISAASAVLQAIGYFKASNTHSGDTFGTALALSGDGSTLAVGAPGEDSSAIDSGAVYVYSRDASGSWTQQAFVKASNAYAGANFGEAVALNSDGNTLVVGAPFENSAATTINGNQQDHSATDAGAVYVFTRSGSTWGSNPTYIKGSNIGANAEFGWAVALSSDGKTLAASAIGDTSNAGAAYVFKYSGTNWSQQAYLKATNSDSQDSFGVALALNATGDILAVGAPLEDSAATAINGSQTNNSATDAGAVYVFNFSNNSWGQPTYLKAPNSGAGDNFGSAVALNSAGDTLAVGAPYEASAAKGINGNQADNSAANAGAVYIFSRNGSTWSAQSYIKASNTEADDDFGTSVSLNDNGNSLLVGAIGESSAAIGINGLQTDNSKNGVGAAYLYTYKSGAWSQSTYLKPSVANVGDEFGTIVALSNDAKTLAISGAYEQSNATGIANGTSSTQTNTAATDAGAVWLF